MLEGVDRIEWNRLGHAHGLAADVPDQLRAVAEGTSQESAQALYDLYGNLWNEGSVYPATAAAIPFLAELAASEGLAPERRVDLLVLLARIGAAAAAGAAGAAADRRAAAAALQREQGRLGLLLDSPEAQVRAAAAGLAGVFPTAPREWRRRLRELRAAAGDPVLEAQLAVAGALAEGRPPQREDVEAAIAADPYLAAWAGERFDGLLGRRLARGAAVELALLLTELALERA